MIYLQQVFDDLSNGEFSQLNFGSGAGVIDDDSMGIVVGHINAALTDLYSRFDLRFKTLQIQIQEGQTEYVISSKSALNGKKTTPPLFVIDSVDDKFNDDILQIINFKLDNGTEMPFNSVGKKWSFNTTAVNRFQIPEIFSQLTKPTWFPENLNTANIWIKYKAAHPRINMDSSGFNPDKFVIELPQTHYTAMLYFCASRATRPLGLNNQFNSGNTYGSMYEGECARLKNNGNEISESGGVSKFYARGFV